MTDYARANSGGATHFTDKDALTTGDADKVIVGAQFDSEFQALVTAVATKYDSEDLASQANAEGESSNTVLMTPLRVANWSDYNAGMVGDIQAMTDPGNDTLLGWDDSASVAIGFTLGTGLTFGDATLAMSHLGLESLSDAGADRIMFWDDSASALQWLTVSTGLDLTTTNLTLSHLGIESLSDAGADSVLFWDDSAGATAWLTFNEGIEFSGAATVGLSDVTATTGQPTVVTNGVPTFDMSSLTSITGAGIAGPDLLLIDDGAGGTNKSVAYQDFGIPVQVGGQYDTITVAMDNLNMANMWYQCNNGSAITVTISANSVVPYPVGTTFAFHQEGAGTITVEVTTDTLRAPNGADTRSQYSTMFVTKVATTEWVVTGDTAT